MITVIIPTFLRCETLRETLGALLAVDYPAELYEVIVVDDAHDEKTAAVVRDHSQARVPVRIVRHDRHGAAAARNAGARAARGSLLLFCDDDMIVRADHLRLHAATHAAHPNSLVGGDRWYTPNALAVMLSTSFGRYRVALERGFARNRDGERLSEDCVETTTLASCDLSLSREGFWHLGGFDETFPYAGAEDQDLSLRAQIARYRLIRNLKIRPGHNDPATSLRQFGERERRGAHTVLALGRKWPGAEGEFANNTPIRRDDPWPLMAKKAAKAALSRRASLDGLQHLAETMERAQVPDRALWQLYRVILGLYIFRGYREALALTPVAD